MSDFQGRTLKADAQRRTLNAHQIQKISALDVARSNALQPAAAFINTGLQAGARLVI